MTDPVLGYQEPMRWPKPEPKNGRAILALVLGISAAACLAKISTGYMAVILGFLSLQMAVSNLRLLHDGISTARRTTLLTGLLAIVVILIGSTEIAAFWNSYHSLQDQLDCYQEARRMRQAAKC